MSGKLEINFEVHIQQGGDWELHSRYPASKKELALADAKSLENISTVQAVKVIRDSFDPDQGTSSESSIYDSSKPAPPPRQAAPPPKSKPKPKPKPKPKLKKKPEAEEEEEKRERMSVLNIVIRLLLILLVSLVIGGMFMAMGGIWMRDTSFAKGTQQNILFGIFVVTFLVSGISIGKTVLAKQPLDVPLGGGRRRSEKTAKEEKNKPPKKEEPKEPLPDIMPGEGIKEEGARTPEEEEARKKAEEEARKKAEQAEDAADKLQSPQAETNIKYLMGFLGAGLEAVKVSHDMQDNYNKFGVNMFLAGACDALSQARSLDERTKSIVLGDAVRSMGFKKVDAENFSEKSKEYLMADSRYMQMFQAGRNAMNTYLHEEEHIGANLQKALAEWNKPKEKEDKSGPITVMFTDMVGSTALTQSKGDAMAQEVVRAHNRIVRDALTEFTGKEIKHTGDGIMASFATTSNGVEASIAIQKRVAEHNKANPNLPLHLKIGINAGEPIAEDDDLFGTTVQLSARIVDKAQSEQIFVSETVFGICAGKGIKFTSRGKFAMKGFDDDLTLYEVVWDENAPAAPAAEDKKAEEEAQESKNKAEEEEARKQAEEEEAKKKAEEEKLAAAQAETQEAEVESQEAPQEAPQPQAPQPQAPQPQPPQPQPQAPQPQPQPQAAPRPQPAQAPSPAAPQPAPQQPKQGDAS